MKIQNLKEHCKNDYYFDSMTSEQFEELKKSINENGLIHKIVCTSEGVIISGHQRYKALKSLEIEEVEVMIKDFDNENDIENALIDANIQSRQGLNGLNPIKIVRILDFKKERYNIVNGIRKDYKEAISREIGTPKTMQDLAEELGMTLGQLQAISQVNRLSDEFQDLVEEGKIKFGTLKGTVTKLSQEEQRELLKVLDVDNDTRKTLEAKIEAMKRQLEEKPKEVIKEVVKIETKEVVPSDYDTLKMTVKGLTRRVENADNDIKRKEKELESLKKMNMETEGQLFAFTNLKRDIEKLAREKEDFMQQLNDIGEISEMLTEIEIVIEKKLAPLKYSTSLSRVHVDTVAKKSVDRLLGIVRQWTNDIEDIINNGGIVNE